MPAINFTTRFPPSYPCNAAPPRWPSRPPEGLSGLERSQEAEAELANIAPEFQTHPFVLELRYKIFEKAGRWDQAVAVAEDLRATLPESLSRGTHFYLAYSLHELKRTQEAYDTLAPVVSRFPEHYLMRYNLACYACQLGKYEEAMTWLAKAIELAGNKEVILAGRW